MDALGDLLDGPRARRAFLLRTIMEPPWSMRIQDEAPISLVTMVSGGAWVIPDDGDPVHLAVGDVAVMRGPDHYTVADDPGTAPQVVVHPDQTTTTPDGEELCEAMNLGVRTYGEDLDGSAVMLSGSYMMAGEISDRLLRALPPVLVLRHDECKTSLITLLADEITRDEPGQQSVLDRLLDLLLISVLRIWFSRPEARPPAWYRAYGDAVVGRALRAIHHNPAHPWTVASLAAEVGVSRAALSQRFSELVGEPPMSYLTSWRLSLAADLLRDSDITLDVVARRVGYGSSFALSSAFKRTHGVSPQEYRKTA